MQSQLEAVRVREREARRHGLKSATKMMLVIVASYLLCNLLNLFITFWEILDKEHLVINYPEVQLSALVSCRLRADGQPLQAYEMGTDVVSLLTITNSSLRLPIYYVCNPKIRQEVSPHRLESTERLSTWPGLRSVRASTSCCGA